MSESIEPEHIPDLRENRGYFSDVDRACRRALERRGLMLTREQASKLTRGSEMAEKTRAKANRLTDAERQHFLAKAMQVIYRMLQPLTR